MPAKLTGTAPASTGDPQAPHPKSLASPDDLSKRTFFLVALALAALALGMGLVRLTRNDVWFDEAASLFFARQRGLDFFRVFLREDTHGPFYYGLLKVWTWAFGEGDWISRLPSVLCSGASVFTVAHLGARLFGRSVGLFAALLVALSPFHLYYAQEIRFYSFIAWMASLHVLCFVHLIDPRRRTGSAPTPPSRWPWWGFVATGTACLLTFYMSGLLLVSELVCAILLRKHIDRKRVVGAFAAASLLPAAWVPAVAWQIRHSHGSIKWIPSQPTWQFLRHTCTIFTAGKGATWFDMLVQAALVAAVLVAVVQITRRRMSAQWPLFFWFLLPLVAILTISLRRPLYEARYFLMILPAFFLLAAAGLREVRWRSIRWPLMGMVVVALALADARYYQTDKFGQRWRDAVAYLRRQAIATDTVVALPSHEIATITYYLPDFPHLRGANWGPDINRLLVRGQRLWVLTHHDHWKLIAPTITNNALQVDSRTFGSLEFKCLLLVR